MPGPRSAGVSWPVSLTGRDAQSAVGRTLSDSHFVAMFPALAGARLAGRRGDWGQADRAAAAAVELGRRGAGRVELAAALLTAAATVRTAPPPIGAGAPDGIAAAAALRTVGQAWRRTVTLLSLASWCADQSSTGCRSGRV
jgi:hypothetical protein